MRTQSNTKTQSVTRLARSFSLLFNRAQMYNTSHPTTVQSTSDFHKALKSQLKQVSPIAILCHRDAIYVDDEELDKKVNVTRMVSAFKEAGVESISFEEGVGVDEINLLLDLLTDTQRFSNADAMKKALINQGVTRVAINHVVYRKVTEGEVVVSAEDAPVVSGAASGTDNFLDRLIQTHTPSEDTGLLSRIFGRRTKDQSSGFATGVMRGLDELSGELDDRLNGMDGASIEKLAKGLMNLKGELKAKGDAPGGALVQRAEDVADSVILGLIQKEYDKGKVTTQRLAQIIRRIVPDAGECRRLLPSIEALLLGEGMAISEFENLVSLLEDFDAGQEVMDAIAQGAETIGLHGQELLHEITRDPRGAAELIYLASEIRQGRGDGALITDILVEYIERIGGKMAMDTLEEGVEGAEHLESVVRRLEREIVHNLRDRGLPSDVMDSVVGKLSHRMAGCLEKLESDWGSSTLAGMAGPREDVTEVLSYFEETIDSMADFRFVLEKAKESIGELKIVEKEEKKRDGDALPQGVLNRKNALYFVEKELQRSFRYKTPFSVALFSAVSARATIPVKAGTVTTASIFQEVLTLFRDVIRDTDSLAVLSKSRFMVLMPMAEEADARIALKRLLKELHGFEVEVHGAPIELNFTGSVTSCDVDAAPDYKTFIARAETHLVEMAQRLKNIKSLL